MKTTTTRKATTKAPAAPKFRTGQRVKWDFEGLTVYGTVVEARASASRWLVACKREADGTEVIKHEGELTAAAPAPAEQARWCAERAADTLADALLTARRTLTKCVDSIREAGWGCGDLFAAYADKTAHAGKVDSLLSPAASFLRREDKTDDEKRAGLRGQAEEWMRRILSDDGYRHNSTAEYDSIVNRAHFRAMQDAYKVLSSVVHDLDRAAAYRLQHDQCFDEGFDPQVERLPGRSW